MDPTADIDRQMGYDVQLPTRRPTPPPQGGVEESFSMPGTGYGGGDTTGTVVPGDYGMDQGRSGDITSDIDRMPSGAPATGGFLGMTGEQWGKAGKALGGAFDSYDKQFAKMRESAPTHQVAQAPGVDPRQLAALQYMQQAAERSRSRSPSTVSSPTTNIQMYSARQMDQARAQLQQMAQAMGISFGDRERNNLERWARYKQQEAYDAAEEQQKRERRRRLLMNLYGRGM